MHNPHSIPYTVQTADSPTVLYCTVLQSDDDQHRLVRFSLEVVRYMERIDRGVTQEVLRHLQGRSGGGGGKNGVLCCAVLCCAACDF